MRSTIRRIPSVGRRTRSARKIRIQYYRVRRRARPGFAYCPSLQFDSLSQAPRWIQSVDSSAVSWLQFPVLISPIMFVHVNKALYILISLFATDDFVQDAHPPSLRSPESLFRFLCHLSWPSHNPEPFRVWFVLLLNIIGAHQCMHGIYEKATRRAKLIGKFFISLTKRFRTLLPYPRIFPLCNHDRYHYLLRRTTRLTSAKMVTQRKVRGSGGKLKGTYESWSRDDYLFDFYDLTPSRRCAGWSHRLHESV